MSTSGGSSSGNSKRGSVIAAAGDSIAAWDSTPTLTVPHSGTADSWFEVAIALSMGRLTRGVNAGISGNTGAGMLLRLPIDVFPKRPDYCIVHGPGNDGALSVASRITTMQACYTACRAAGVEPIATTALPKPLVAGGTDINPWIRAYCAAQGIMVLDFERVLMDPATGNSQAAMVIADNIHPNGLGKRTMALYALGLLAPLYRGADVQSPSQSADPYNLALNALMLADSNADNIPDNWSVFAAGTAVQVLTIGAEADGLGKLWSIQTTVAGTGTVYRQTINTGFAVGNSLRFTARIQTVGVEAGGGTYYLWLDFTGSGGQQWLPVSDWDTDISDGIVQADFTVPAGTTAIDVKLFSGTGTGTIRLGRVALRNLTTLGVSSLL